MAKQPEDWFRKAIVTGLETLYALGLDRNPAHEVIPATAEVWINTLWPTRVWIEEIHRPRIAEAFRKLCKERETWPPPSAFLVALPAWNPTLKALKKQLSDAELEKNRETLAFLMKNLCTPHAA